MSQLLDTLAGMDPAGDAALLLCVIIAALLGVVILVGFGLIQPPARLGRKGARRRASTAADLDLLALWRLKGTLGKGDQTDVPVSPRTGSGTTP